MEVIVRSLNNWMVSLCQLLALFVIFTGIVKSLLVYLRHGLLSGHSALAFQESRLEMGYAFSLGLGFLIGGSILKTTIAPSWNDIGQLAAIIAIRTLLNSLLLQAITGSSSDGDDRDRTSLWDRLKS
ncbi:MAG: DUF1622 domain-containing protein [Cyanobacteria bacterium J007]|jgi:uncharacterized membrane protein|nr:MAG: DUF1622 domain-containing protein [Cyanobacteria bacterium J007]